MKRRRWAPISHLTSSNVTLQFTKFIHKSYYHSTRIHQEKIIKNIFFQRPTYLLKRLYLQHVATAVKNCDECYDYHAEFFNTKSSYKNVQKEWWGGRFLCPFTGQVYNSGKISDIEYRRLLRNIGLKDMELATMEKDSIYYHKRKYMTKEAIASTVLHSWITRGQLDKNYLERFCSEDPYLEPGNNDPKLTLPSILSPKFSSLRSILQFLYTTHEHPSTTRNCFEYRSLELPAMHESGEKTTWFTASFTSPLTGEKFHAGTLYPIDLQTSENFLTLQTQSILGKVYYTKVTDALEAAAARALDCFVFRGMAELESAPILESDRNPTTNHTIMQDTVSESISESSTQSLPVIDASTKREDLRISITETKSPNNERYSSVSQAFYPTCMLSRLYVISYQLPSFIDESSYQFYEESFPTNTQYSATFTCPITAAVYDSKDLNMINNPLSKNEHLLSAVVQSKDGKNYNKKKSHAKEAAAAHALSSLIMEKKLCRLERLCKEEPYDAVNDFSQLFRDYQKPTQLRIYYAYRLLMDLYLRNLKMETPEKFDECFFVYTPHLFPSSANPAIYQQYWTCSFTCPITGETFDAGTLILLELGTTDFSKYSSLTYDGKNYYSKKYVSKEAAASRALDCFIYRGCLGNDSCAASGHLDENVSTKVTFENIAVFGNESLSPSQLTPNAASRQWDENGSTNVTFENITVSSNELLSPSKNTVPTSEEPTSLHPNDSVSVSMSDTKVTELNLSAQTDDIHKESITLPNPKTMLDNHFVDRKLQYNSVALRTSVHVLDPTMYNYWTSHVIDPNTGEIFPSGILKDVEEKDMENRGKEILLPPLCFALDGKVYYFHKKMAERAAAAMAIDSYCARGVMQSGSNSHRYCKDEPLIRAITETSTELLTLKDNEEPSALEGEDDFVVQHIPGAISSDGLISRSTMDRILEAWAGSSFSPTFSLPNTTSFNVQDKPALAAVAVSSALNWLEKLTTVQRRSAPSIINDSMQSISLSSVNSLLAALGEANHYHANQDSKLVHNGEIIDIETIAKRLLDRLIVSPKDLDDVSVRPNTETFNAYITCLRHPHGSLETAVTAHKLLIDMLNQGDYNGFKLPLPNENTFNEVLKIWGRIPSLGRQKMDEIFSLMQSTSLVRPNRDTFLCYLSSLPIIEISSEKGMDPNYLDAATSVIEKMKMYEAQDGVEYAVNREVYNAPLPHWAEFSVRQVYNGFASCKAVADNKRVAENVERWIYDMERSAHENGEDYATPDIRTYESAIFSWSLTGTRYGIERAEHWAERVIKLSSTDSEMAPGSQTFYPIVNGWVYSGEKNSPEKVKQWIEKASELKCTRPNLNVIATIHEAQALAWRNYHRQIISSYADGSSRSTFIENIFDVAHKCSKCLEDLLPQPLNLVEDQNNYASCAKAVADVWLDSCMFLAFRCTEDSCTDSNTLPSLDYAIHQIFSVVRTIDNLSDSALTNQGELNKLGEEHAQYKSTLLISVNIYMAVLRTLFTLSQSKTTMHLLFHSFQEIEKMIRRVVEFSIILEMNQDVEAFDFRLDDDRLFDRIKVDDAQTSSAYSEQLLVHFLSFLENNNTPIHHIGDVIRVVNFLISQVAHSSPESDTKQSVNENTLSLYKRTIELINRTIDNEEEKAVLLYRIYNENKSSALIRAAITDCCPAVSSIRDQHQSTEDYSSLYTNTLTKRRTKFRRRYSRVS